MNGHPAQYAVITDDGRAKFDDDQIVPLINGTEFGAGDQGMAEFLNGRWEFVLYEAAPRPSKPSKSQPKGNPRHKTAKPAGGRTRAPKVAVEPTTQDKLWCEIGQHDWYRDKAKGKKPRNCPQHKQAQLQTKDSGLTTILSTYKVDRETEFKLRYIARELQRGRKPKDVAFLLDEQSQIVQRLRRAQEAANLPT